MQVSTITQKGQATIPAQVRKALGVGPGDKICFELFDGEQWIVKIRPFDHVYHQALSNTLTEWNSPEDDVYNDL